MTKLITRLISRSILLRNTIQNSTKNQQQLRFYEKKVSPPAPYITINVVKDKIADSSPVNSTILAAFVIWSIYFIFNGIEFEEIKNYRELRSTDNILRKD